jgi:hypothetical protein
VRWEVVPVIFGLAGAAGGALDALLAEVVVGRYGDSAGVCAFIGGGIGLGIGATLCVSRKLLVRLTAAPVLGVAGYFLLMCIGSLAYGERLPRLGELPTDWFALYLAAPAAPVLVLAHHLHLRWRERGRSAYASLPLYAVLGALSGSLFWLKHSDVVAGLLDGALYGLCQHVAMMAALGLEKWRGEPEAAQGFSPRQ